MSTEGFTRAAVMSLPSLLLCALLLRVLVLGLGRLPRTGLGTFCSLCICPGVFDGQRTRGVDA